MKQNRLGKTDLHVSLLGLGSLFVATGSADLADARRAVHRAVEFGINYIDTAPGYGDSEEVLGQILPGINVPLILSTKLGGRPKPFDPRNKDQLRYSVERSLQLLKRDVIDILMVHEPDRPAQYDWWTDTDHFTGPVLEVLDELKRAGKIRYTGLGGTTAYEMPRVMESERFDVVLTAFNYSLLWREATHEIVPAANRMNMGLIIGSPLQQGALARRYDEQIATGARWMSPSRRQQFQALYRLLDECGIELAELAMRFIISNPHVHCVLSGIRSVGEVEKNAAAIERGPLSADLLAQLDQIAAMVPFRPFDEPFGLPFTWDYKGPGIPQ